MNDFSTYATPFICLARHGETELTAARCYNGVRDIPLTAPGEQDATRLAPVLSRATWDRVICSPLQRAIRTAALAGFQAPPIVPALREFDYGDYEGRTTRQIPIGSAQGQGRSRGRRDPRRLLRLRQIPGESYRLW